MTRYERMFGLRASQRSSVTEQQVEVAFLPIGTTQIELISPTAPDTGVARFLDLRGEALHHVAFAVEDIRSELQELEAQGVELIDRTPRRGAHGLVAFVHPRSTGGVLYELIEHVGDDLLQS